MRYRMIDVDGIDVFRREDGEAGAPNRFPLHSFPSSSHTFRDHASNAALYPAFLDDFQTNRTPPLAVWGRNNRFFLLASFEA